MQSWISLLIAIPVSWILCDWVLTSAKAEALDLDRPSLAGRWTKGSEPAPIVSRELIGDYILGANQDPAGLDFNNDGTIDVADILCLVAWEKLGPEIGSHAIY